jgi:SAM-dependent MidA family methyltransferase
MQQVPGNSLPAPDAASRAHSERVAAFIRERISEGGGAISFAEYMHYALYATGLGYYAAGSTRFGEAGDFVTAPEVSPLFGKVLARQCAGVMVGLDSPSVLEIGAGSGRLAVDILQKLDELDALPDRYSILEVSADLRERQAELIREAVPTLAERVDWLDDLPDSHSGVIIANEVLDALPVERFSIESGRVYQHCVVLEGDRLVIRTQVAPELLADAVAAIESDLGREFPEGYVSEVCLAAPGWITDVAASLRDGIMFLFDYGLSRREYYAPDRSGGWLRCHFRHHAHNDPLVLPGIQDITAWVDFTGIAAAAVEAGLQVAGFASQAQFLLHGGLDEEMADLANLDLEEQMKLSGQIKLLTLPGEMGENFKCIGLARGEVPLPPAFARGDRTMSL